MPIHSKNRKKHYRYFFLPKFQPNTLYWKTHTFFCIDNRILIMFAIPEAVYSVFPEHYEGINLVLWVIFTVELFLFGIYFTIRAQKAEMSSQKKVEIGFALFGYFYGLCRLFFILMIKINNAEDYDFYCSIAYFWGILAVAVLVYPLETVALNRKPYLSIVGFVASIISLLGAIPGLREPMLVLTMISSTLVMMVFLLVYIFLIRNTSGVLRQNTIIGFVSILLLVFAIFTDGQIVLSNPAVPKFFKEIIVPICAIISIIGLVYSKKKI